MKPLLLALLAVGLFSGCSTVSSRIKKDPSAYSSLSPRDQQLVRTGHVREGLSPAAVYLAWGKADTIRRGSRRGQSFETWTYLETDPSSGSFYARPYVTRFGGFYGRPYYGAGIYAGPFYDDFYEDNRLVPYRSAMFERGKLVAWSDQP